MSKRGLLLVVSGPSGVGKGTASKLLLNRIEGLQCSVSATTRMPRNAEADGVSYFFIAAEEFMRMIAGDEFLEWAEVYGNYYGTPKKAVEELLTEGKDVILELDTQGAMQVKRLYPQGIFIFIMPPSREELKRRITARGSETPESLACRLDAAEYEMSLSSEYDYVVINNDLDHMVDELVGIIERERLKKC